MSSLRWFVRFEAINLKPHFKKESFKLNKDLGKSFKLLFVITFILLILLALV